MTMDDETFFAWLDGELEPSEAARVEAVVAADPTLSARADEHRAMQASLRGAFAPLMDAPVPDRIGEAPVDFAAAKAARDDRRRLSGGLPQWAAIAATLVLGLVAGNMLPGPFARADRSPVTMEGGRLVANAGLENALYAELASAPAKDGPRIGLTYRDAAGEICRSFRDGRSSGVACNANGDWEVRGLFGGAAPSGGDYRMAAGEDPRLAALIADSIAGEPFDAAAERAAMARGWR